MEYLSAIKKNEIMLFAGKMDESINYHVERDKPSSERQLHKYQVFSLM
jgi:hypothetical protein